jgi:hypothetical protein
MGFTSLVETIVEWNNVLTCKGNAITLYLQPTCVALGAVQWWILYFAVAFGVFQVVHVWAIATQFIKRSSSSWLWKISLTLIILSASTLTTVLLLFQRITGSYDNPFVYCMVSSRSCAR